MTTNFSFIKLEQIDSTNRYLTSLCEEKQDRVAPFTTVFAEFQSAGKGQRGNSWESEKGANLTFSFVLYPSFLPANRQFVISQIVSLGIVRSLSKYETDGCAIKWPNDIYFGDKKICGILIEVYLENMNLGRCVCGVGLNVNQAVFHSDAPNPVSLSMIIGKDVDRMQLLEEIMDEIHNLYSQLENAELAEKDLADIYFQNLYRKEGYHRYKDIHGEFSAKLLNVEPDGRLILEDENQQRRSYLFKEIQYII
ncbi:MAG: biotin--[acetyl-CoA-carboxylase] ligase [Bacteroidaceae bacterium]|nr:biotin--[acetyl-CoA-carboxylase] ligase [Bacteroidaceae bacterium]